MKQFYEKIKSLKKKEKRRKIINYAILTIIILLCAAVFVLFIINRYIELYAFKYRYTPLIIVLIFAIILAATISYVTLRNQSITNKTYNCLYDFLAKQESSENHSVSLKVVRKYLKDNYFSGLNYRLKNYHISMEHKYGYMAEATLINTNFSSRRPKVNTLFKGVTFTFKIPTNHEFIYYSKKRKDFYGPNNFLKTNYHDGILLYHKKEPNNYGILKIIDALYNLLPNQSFFLRYTPFNIYLVIERDFFFTIEESTSIYTYQDAFRKLDDYIDEIYQLFISLKNY